MEQILQIVLFLFCFTVLTNCYPQGAPVRPESCEALQPIHRNRVTQQQIGNQIGQAPYRIFMSQNQYVPCTQAQQCGQYPITVAIRGVPGQTAGGIQGQPTAFRGFILQARTRSRGNRSVGQFIPARSQDSKIIQCTNGLTLTHSSNLDKQEVRFQWIPEPGLREDIQFVSTIVQNLNTIYPRVYAPPAKPSARPQVNVVVTPTPSRTTTSSSTSTTTTSTTTSVTTPTSTVTTPTITNTTYAFFNSGTKTSAGLAVSVISLLAILL